MLRGPNCVPLEVVGKTSLKLTYKGKSSVQRVFVIKHLQNNLLGLPAIKALELIRGLDAITQSIIATLIHYPDTPNDRAIDGQVCFHRWPFANPRQSTTGSMEPLRGTNKAVSVNC